MPNVRRSKKYSQRRAAVTDERVLQRLEDAEREILDDPNPYRDDRHVVDDITYAPSENGILVTFTVTQEGLRFLDWRDRYNS